MPAREPGDKHHTGGSHPTGSVDDYMRSLDDPRKDQIELIRQIILGVDPAIRETIKWNAPSFFTSDDFATLNLRGKHGIRLVLHLGTKARRPAPTVLVDDPAGLLQWLSPDRAVATFKNIDDIATSRIALQHVIRDWITHV